MLEVLVVMGTISLLAAILLPVAVKVRGEARQLLCLANLRQIALVATNYASDNDNSYPESVATIGQISWWWQDPRMMAACQPRKAGFHRSMSAYLRRYIKDTSIMFCPAAPTRYKYLQEAWDAGDNWDHPDTYPNILDPVSGTYCYYWNYLGILEVGPSWGGRRWFRGPRELCGGRGQSELLVSDYFGYNHRDKNAYGSCEPLKGACITGGSDVSSDYWSVPKQDENMAPDTFRVELHAAYADGHAETYLPSHTVPMWVSMSPDGSEAYNVVGDLEPGIYYLPENAAR
ncbi:MAG: type II secretion system protein [Planctomycetota bacterium]